MNNFSSKRYWEKRYRSGRNSGAGSYNEAATFKAKVINEFIQQNGIIDIVDMGCGDGNQLSLFKGYSKYYGFDVSSTIIKKLKIKFKDFCHIRFYDTLVDLPKAELVLSLDVLFHLVEPDIYKQYILNLFNQSKKYIIVYSRNANVKGSSHYRCREFIKDIKQIIGLEPFKTVEVPDVLVKKKISYNTFAFYDKG